MNIQGKIIHDAIGSGHWFPGAEDACRDMVEHAIEAAAVPSIPGQLLGGISPHAGYVFSGGVAGHTFRVLRDKIEAGQHVDTVVVLGFSHRSAVDGVLVMDGHGLRTPLGTIALDREGGDLMHHQSQRIRIGYGAHEGEHSAENQVPFVQAAAPTVRLISALVGGHSRATIEMLREALAALAEDKQIVVIASTDLLHDPNYEDVKRTDAQTLSMIEALDVEGLRDAWTPERQVCCGIGPVLTAMTMTHAVGGSARSLTYCNSGDDAPETRGHWVVGYGSLVFHM